MGMAKCENFSIIITIIITIFKQILYPLVDCLNVELFIFIIRQYHNYRLNILCVG